MQSLIHQIQGMLGGNVGLIIGYILLGLLAVYAAALCYGTFQRISFEREQQSLTRERLKLEIKAAQAKTREVEQTKLVWNGVRKFQVVKKICECEDVNSFYLVPHDGRPLAPFKPGQYITFQLNLPGQSKPVIRCYSLSDSHRPNQYRVTIKKALPPPDCEGGKCGIASSYFNDTVKEGDILDVKAPNGHFFLDMSEEKPVVLISGGVGITPMVAMLNAIVESGQKREVWFFFGARNRKEHILKEHLEKIAAAHENVHLHVCYSKPGKDDVKGQDYQHEGRVSVDLFKQLLPSSNYEYFLCGPGAFMKSITDALAEWGVPDANVHFEAFGPASVKKAAPAVAASDTMMLSKITVTFGRSGKTHHWNPAMSSLLDFAEDKGVKIDAGCRAGNCGTCLVAIKSGDVEYVTSQGASAETGSCLTCICKPKGNLVLDA
jgi:ferredoxin-NADP reductase